jgi:multiple sugar transport system substrate-binding protein
VRKHLVVWMTIGLLAIVGTGFAAAKTTLTFWNGFTGPDRPVLEQLVAEFNEANPDIEIKMDIQPWDTLFQKLMTAYVVGKGPDIAAFATENIPQYASAGVLAPLDDIYESGQLDPTVLVPAILENVKYEDKSYAVPMNFATLLLYYNKDHFGAARP